MNAWREGSQFGPYELKHRLGGGGFGEVWLAAKPGESNVAVKILHGQRQTGEHVRIRAEIELLAAAASSRSSHIVRVLDGGSEPAPYVVMEYIEGVDLGSEITRRGALPVTEVLRIADAIADALGTLQLIGIIHRDVKPANVMIDRQGLIKLTDFGIAKIVGIDSVTATSQMPMSMAYAAPEVWEGKASYLSDHYAFGALLYQCLVGRPPFGGSYAEIYRHHLLSAPDMSVLPQGTPAALSSLIEQCLAKDPAARPQSATELHNAVSAAQREMEADLAATVVETRLHEPRQLGPWVIDSRSDETDWAFLCHHETSGDTALVEVRFSDSLDESQRLREVVATQPHYISTSRFILRPGEGFTGAPTSLFVFWLARKHPDEAATEASADATPAEVKKAEADATQVASPDRIETPPDPDATQVGRPGSREASVAKPAVEREVAVEPAVRKAEPAPVDPAPIVRRSSAEGQRIVPSDEAENPLLAALLLNSPRNALDMVARAGFYIGLIVCIMWFFSQRGHNFDFQTRVLFNVLAVLLPLVSIWAFARFGPQTDKDPARSHRLSLIRWPEIPIERAGHLIVWLVFLPSVAAAVYAWDYWHHYDGLITGSTKKATFGVTVAVVVPLIATIVDLAQRMMTGGKQAPRG